MAHSPARAAPDLGRRDELPLGVQLGWRLRTLIGSGALAPGERLPGVRQLAEGTGLNVNTARAVYRRLEEDGLIVSRHGQGTFVAEGAEAAPGLERLAAEAVDAARAEGVDPRDLARAIYAGSSPAAELERVPAVPPREPLEELEAEPEERPARRDLRTQIARLEAELAAYVQETPRQGEATHPLLRPKAHLPEVGELEAIRDDLIERLKAARAAAEERTARQQRARGRLEQMVSDPASHRWEAVSNEEIGERGCKEYEVRPSWGPVGALMNWWRVKVSSGCP